MSSLMSCGNPQYNDASQSSCSLNNNSNFSSLGDYYSGFQAPLGSQLSLLSAVNASNQKMNLSRTSNDNFRVSLAMPGYNTLSGNPTNTATLSYGSPLALAQGSPVVSGSANYFNMSNAYQG